ncbi:MAG: hypothetical protein KL840_02470 [Aquamicrobium sp.]|nr:hypothetical protein [Aquamicrobium sp.]
MPFDVTKISDWVYRLAGSNEYGSAQVQITISVGYLEQYPKHQREVEALNAASSIIWDIQNNLINAANGSEDDNTSRP